MGDAPALFVLGAARSGTTMLYKWLCLHPEAGYLSNYTRRVPAFPQIAVVNRIPRRAPSLTDRAWFDADQAYTYGQHRDLVRRLAPQPVEGEPVFRWCGFRQYDWEVEANAAVRAQRLGRVARGVLTSSGTDVFISKRIAHNRRARELADALPASRFVVLTRDGRDVAQSLSAVDWWPDDVLWWDGRTPRQWEADGADPWVACARNWVEDVRSIRRSVAQLDADQVLQIRYEDLVADPASVAGDVARFAGLGESAAWRARLESRRRTPAARKFDKLSDEVKETVTAIVTEELAAHGY